jgi:hypothetical protein
MRMHLRYGRYVLRHKAFVYRAGRALGLGRWQLLRHDLSKFRPSEWFPYATYFYGGDRPSRGDFVSGDVRMALWDYCREGVAEAFDRAWLLHQHRNPHHYQFWVLREDSGAVKCLPMPWRYAMEMVADWRGAGTALGKPDTRAWYLHNREHIQLHPTTRAWVERELGVGAGDAPPA